MPQRNNELNVKYKATEVFKRKKRGGGGFRGGMSPKNSDTINDK